MSAFSLVLIGLVLLAFGGEVLGRGATRLAQLARLTPAVIGLTIVAMGTSMPELVVSVAASAEGQAELAIANVIGSNILNITGTLGLVALIRPLPTRTTLVRFELPVLLLATLAVVLTMRDGVIDRLEAAFLVASLVVFTAYSVHIARREATAAEKVALQVQAEALAPGKQRGIPYSLAVVLAGLALLIAGGNALVDGATGIARMLGWSERTIGLTVVAVGTGAPEIAATIIAAIRSRADLAIGNLIGSNIFNLLGIIGLAALRRPAVIGSAFAADGWWMLWSAALLLPVVVIAGRVTRIEGALLLAAYVAYLVFLT